MNHIKALNAFKSGKTTGKYGNYHISGNDLVYRKLIDFSEDDESSHKVVQNVVAKRINGEIFGNSSVLKFVESFYSFGRFVANRKETKIQKEMAKKFPMLPFGVFVEAGLSLESIKIIDRGKEETIKIKVEKYLKDKIKIVIEQRHFTGASLYQIGDKKYLFDIDRREIKHKIFNPFLVEIVDKTVKSIKDAYNSLKPEAVKIAESEGLKVKRQGEWFFIPSKIDVPYNVRVFNGKNERMVLRAGNRNRPNYASSGFAFGNAAYVKGKIEHSGREHVPLILNDWHLAIPNTSFDKSFTITGDID